MKTRRRRQGITAGLVALGVSLILFSGCGDLSHDELVGERIIVRA